MNKRTEYFTRYKRMERKKDKIKCLEHYGSVCACCGEKTPEFLTIDHINGGGRKHRMNMGIKTKGGRYSSSWNYTRRNGFPKDLRILCFNCNSSRGAFGYCPHDISSV